MRKYGEKGWGIIKGRIEEEEGKKNKRRKR
jgi:hypothetical protein